MSFSKSYLSFILQKLKQEIALALQKIMNTHRKAKSGLLSKF